MSQIAIQAGTQVTLLKADAGESPPKRRPKYIAFENAIQKLTQKHQDGDINTKTLLRRARHFVRKYK